MFKLFVAAGFFAHFWHKLIIIFLSCVPVIESRYAITIGMLAYEGEMSTVELFILSQLGAFSVTIILLLFLRKVFNWLKTTKTFKKMVEKLESHGKKKGEKLEGKLKDSASHMKKVWASVIGVFLFVAIPLPGTGVWTGALVATLLNIRFKYSFPAICLGSIVATLIMLGFTDYFLVNPPSWLMGLIPG